MSKHALYPIEDIVARLSWVGESFECDCRVGLIVNFLEYNAPNTEEQSVMP